MEEGKKRKWLFGLLFLLLLMPFTEYCFNFISSKKLEGAVIDSPDVNFNWDGWWSGRYQAAKNAYLNDAVGFRPDLVRINNEVNYLLFNEMHARNVLEGKNMVFYEQTYIDEYCGKNFKGDEDIKKKLQKLKMIQDTLNHLGKTIVLCYAPSKAYYYPDDFPEEMKCAGTTKNSYYEFKRLGDSLHLNLIDFNGWFMQLKKNTPGMLMSKGGIHWTYFGALTAADSLVRYIAGKRQIKMAGIKWDKINYEPARQQEQDIENALNLLVPATQDKYAHPEVKEGTDSTVVKPSTIFLGDSFLWTFSYTHVMDHMSNNWEFWYYFNEMWTAKTMSGQEKLNHIGDYDWFHSLLQKDCLVILYTTPNLHGLGNGFIEAAYDKFYPKK